MREVSKGKLKAKMLEYFRTVEETGEELIVTDNKKPVLRVSRIETRAGAEQVFGDLRGRVVYHSEIMDPTSDEWPQV